MLCTTYQTSIKKIFLFWKRSSSSLHDWEKISGKEHLEHSIASKRELHIFKWSIFLRLVLKVQKHWHLIDFKNSLISMFPMSKLSIKQILLSQEDSGFSKMTLWWMWVMPESWTCSKKTNTYSYLLILHTCLMMLYNQ